ncbi:AAA family ATPase [Lentibacter sp. XHP0401]|uniref:AAA family ATPase n=1 Tax=Lentibacter sp. XHP0401 TaxID=2984334 RepID=UPI0021E90F92|nr:AAA family ATPase [Lentibacter sp. XHP0401]MCV2894510.1 AAA family ATPase [Lentibacter sp. XHP0401]
MRILSISGQNIASLADTFVIDFTAPPLLGAGLFAITGETGAGKSSILDAMCLALYGDAPRLSGGAASDEVPDPSGDTIKAKDSRAILRRGAVQGWAEVRFTALDGEDYIARWQARRARDKVDGRLQSVARSIARAADDQILAGQTSAVAEQMQHLTGLTYDEFRRTVLLAQGDFDAFLRADTNDRAGLLEKVTGSGLYRAISTRVYERTHASRDAHNALMLRHAEHKLLSDEARTELKAEQDALIAANVTDRTEGKSLTASLDLHRQFDAAKVRLTEAETQEKIAAQAVLDAAKDKALLAQIDRAEPLRLPWQAKVYAEKRKVDATSAVKEAEEAARNAAAAAKNLQNDAEDKSKAFDAKEVEFKAFGRVWDQAANLDAQIETAHAETKRASDETQTKAQAATDFRTALDALKRAESETKANQTTAENALSALAEAIPIADHWPQVCQNLTDYSDANASLEKAQNLVSGCAKQLGEVTTRQTEIDESDKVDRTSETELTAELKELEKAINRSETDHPPEKAESLSSLAQSLANLTRIQEAHADAETALATATDAQDNAKTQAQKAIDQRAVAEAALHNAEAQITALVAPVEQADLALSDKARDLRLRLEPDQPCPVCGAKDHPVHADEDLLKLAETLRNNLSTAKGGAETARNQRTTAEGQLAAAQAREKQAQGEILMATQRKSKALTQWSENLRAAQANPLYPTLPAQPADPEKTLLAAVKTLTTQQRAEQAAARELVALRKTLTAKNTSRESLRATISTRSTERDALATTAAEIRQAQALAKQELSGTTTRIEKLTAGLRPTLTAAQEPMSALSDIPALQSRLAALVDRIASARAAQQSASDQLAALGPQIATATSKAESAADQAKHAAETETSRKKALSDLRTARAPLLDGEDTKAHRSRHNEARKTALKTKEEAQNALGVSMQKSATAKARYDNAQNTESNAAAALEKATIGLAQALTETGLETEELAPLFATSRDDVEKLRHRLRQLDDTVTAARSATASRRADLDKLQSTGLPETSAADLSVALNVIDAAMGKRQERIGTISGDLARDDATRKTLVGLEAETAKAKAELEVWQAVNDAIGSRNGDRFARVAQSITLDVLVDRANHHLADLNPRYLLRRADDLALQVEDRDMAGEARATRSLSGGERFLVSLALALALSRMGSQGGLAATLFIDEGFGSLDATSLDLAIDALETLQSQGRQVGVISHVEAMKDRIPTRIAVRKQGGGKSAVSISGLCGPGGATG